MTMNAKGYMTPEGARHTPAAWSNAEIIAERDRLREQNAELIDKLYAANENAVAWKSDSFFNGKQCSELFAINAKLIATLQRIAEGSVMSGEFTHAETVIAYQEIARAALAKAQSCAL